MAMEGSKEHKGIHRSPKKHPDLYQSSSLIFTVKSNVIPKSCPINVACTPGSYQTAQITDKSKRRERDHSPAANGEHWDRWWQETVVSQMEATRLSDLMLSVG